MKPLKTLTALCLSMLLIMPMSYTQSQPVLNRIPQKQFKIELGKAVYSKEEVEKILAITFEETNKGIDTAFFEGYKQGLLAAAPDKEYYKALSEELQKTLQEYETKAAVPWWTVPVSIIGGVAVGFSLGYVKEIRWDLNN